MISINFSGGVKLNFANPPELAKWFAEKERVTLQLANRTKAKKEQIRAKGTAAAYAEIAALLSAATIEPTQAH